ncbi:MAG: hypothetical protein ACE5H4_05175 [Candidatus Thorarchaeota archaeon]
MKVLYRLLVTPVIPLVAELNLEVKISSGLPMDLNPITVWQILSSLYIVSGMAVFQGVQRGIAGRKRRVG